MPASTEPDRFTRAIKAVDLANAEDPNREYVDGKALPKELVYSRRMSDQLARFAPDAKESVRLAVHAQHVTRWKIPRVDYPAGRAGYHRWRQDLAKMHAEIMGEILAECGYESETVDEVRVLLRKKGLRTNPDVQLLEDVVCLVFLEHYWSDFRRKHAHDEEKLIGIVKKTWNKMSRRAQDVALTLPLAGDDLALIKRALI